MFRLIKLALYAFVGYALYELYQGMTARQPQQAGGPTAVGGGASRGASDASFGHGQNLTGAGVGRTEATLDSDGGSVRHRVGRGVVSR